MEDAPILESDNILLRKHKIKDMLARMLYGRSEEFVKMCGGDTRNSGYTDERSLNDDENNVLSDTYAISSGLWFTKTLCGENSLTKLVECNEYDKVDLLLQEIYSA